MFAFLVKVWNSGLWVVLLFIAWEAGPALNYSSCVWVCPHYLTQYLCFYLLSRLCMIRLVEQECLCACGFYQLSNIWSDPSSILSLSTGQNGYMPVSCLNLYSIRFNNNKKKNTTSIKGWVLKKRLWMGGSGRWRQMESSLSRWNKQIKINETGTHAFLITPAEKAISERSSSLH